MPEQFTQSAPSPPKGVSASSSIFAYQTRILLRTSSTTNGSRPSSHSHSFSNGGITSLAALANASPPSTPIRQNVAKMAAMENQTMARSGSGRAIGLGPGMKGRSAGAHGKGSKSVELVRGQWESKISDVSTIDTTPVMPRKRTSVFSPPLQPSSTMSASPKSPPVRTPSSGVFASAMSPERTGFPGMTSASMESEASNGGGYRSSYMAARAAKRAGAPGTNGYDPVNISDSTSIGSVSSTTSTNENDTIRQRATSTSITSYTSILSPSLTGSSGISGIASERTQAVEDTLAVARANALKRLEARKKAKAGASDQNDATKRVVVTETPTKGLNLEPKKSSPFGDLFVPSTSADLTPTRNPKQSSPTKTPTSSNTRSPYRPIVTPPSAPSWASSRHAPSGLSSNTPQSSSSGSSSTALGSGGPGGKDKYGSLSRTDKRRLGRHLPRIASGDGGWDDEVQNGHMRGPSASDRRPSALGRSSVDTSATRDSPPSVNANTAAPSVSMTPSSRPKPEVLAPCMSENRPSHPASVPSTPGSKPKSAYLPQTPKSKSSAASGFGLVSPRPEVAGEEMKGLMNAVGSMPVRGGTSKDDGEGLTGMSNRLRLSRSTLPPSASSASVAPAPLPSRRLLQTNWMDRQRHALASYEYLCHVGEAQQWVEGCLEEETGFGVTEMEEGLRDGVVLAKLARAFQGEAVVRRIWTDSKHRYKQTDNIDVFLKFLKTVGMPRTFMFDPIDLYDKKNVPKVIFCLHILSHLLAKQGLAERIGDLVGQFEFTDEQLATTQKGLQGLAMPNFGDVRKTLAKEASWAEPEEPEETEDERRDRELLGCEASIINLQRHLRGRLAKMRTSRTYTQLELAEPIIVRFQARSRGALSRRSLLFERDERANLGAWATALQATARGYANRRRFTKRFHAVHASETSVIGVQAQLRGMVARVRRSIVQTTLDKSVRSITGLQTACRGCIARRTRKEHQQSLLQPQVAHSVTAIQAVLRGRLLRQASAEQQQVVTAHLATFTSLQSHLRGALVRRGRRAQEEKVDSATDCIVAIQSAARGILARRKKQYFVLNIQQTTPAVTSLQAIARARLAKQAHSTMQKALAKVEVAGSVGGLQAFLRTKLAKRQTTEQKKKLEFVQPDVIGFQAIARGYLARQEFREWRDYLQDPHTQGALIFLQSLVRGFIARRRLYLRTSYIHRNVNKVMTIQSLWRGRAERQMYDKLLTGVDVDVPTIQNYMHLLDDTDADYQRQIRTENMRKEVVTLIRENQSLETEVKELDTKIALILKNKMTFEDLVRVEHNHANGDRHGHKESGSFSHHANRDPFTTGAHRDRASQRKLELFEHLFFTLQTKGVYLSRLLHALSRSEEDEKDRRLVDNVTLVLFGFGHERREEYLFHRLLQLAVHEEILRSRSLADLAETRFAIISVATQYLRPHLTPYIQDVLKEHVMRVVEAAELDLTTDPGEIYRRLINEEESRTGMPTSKARDLDGNQVLQTDEHARALYIQHLQELRHLTKQLLETLCRSTQYLPYTVGLLAREALLALRVKYPDAADEELAPIVARTVLLPFILPAIIAPETFGIAPQGVGPVERRNLAIIANLISHVAAQEMTNTVKDWFVRTPLQEYIRSDGALFRDFVLDVASVDPLETYFQAHELFESTLEATPITITRTEIYGMLSILMKQIPVLTAGKNNDPIGIVLAELEGPPVDYDRSRATFSLRLTNRLAELQGSEPEAMQKEDWVQAKRHVLAVLRVQNGRTLFDVLVARPGEEQEQLWLDTVYRDMARERAKRAKHDLPPTPAEAEYQIESIRSLPFHEVKSRAIEFCMKLERVGKLSRNDNFQGLLVSMAGDIRQKHHLRKMQRQASVAMERAHGDMSRKHLGFEEQINSYHQFIDSSMASLQKGKKKPTFLSKQYFHQRSEAKSGKRSQFGSFKYTAHDIYTRGILLGINQVSPTVFHDVSVVIASNEVGIFCLEMTSSTVPLPNNAVMAREQVRMEDLLQAQFENELNLLLFDGMATFSINMLIHQINKKFYSS